jgi:sterol desaturase/sphingolipid hydroxylase (fatty acid hydroxylase superfamily)
LAIVFAIGAGVLGWSLAEYLLHRFYGHHARGRNEFSREHLRHHARRLYFATASKKAAAAVPVLGALGAGATWAAGTAGLAFGASFAAAYVGYEALHRRLHTHGPRGPYGRWARRHHFHHHFGNPWANHGVTSPLWDVVFRTWDRPAQVRVPPHFAMDWLLTEAGDVRPDLAPDYVVGRR